MNFNLPVCCRWFNGSAFTEKTCLNDEWLSVREFETPASKGWWLDEDFVSAFTVFTFSRGTSTTEDEEGAVEVELRDVNGYWRVPPNLDWVVKPHLGNLW